LSVAGCDPGATAQAPEQAYFLLAISSEKPTADGSVTVGGGDLEGVAVVEINGVPIEARQTRESLSSINEWLRKGRNTIYVHGKHQAPLYVSVYRADREAYESSGKVGPLMGEAVFEAGQSGKLSFESDIDSGAPELDLMETPGAERQLLQAEATEFLNHLEGLLEEPAQNREELAEAFVFGTRQWRFAYWLGEADVAAKERELADQFAAASYAKLHEDFKLIVGERGILFVGDRDKFGRPFSWTLVELKDSTNLAPLVLVRFQGKLRIWNRWD
jgi:hypothetical protein